MSNIYYVDFKNKKLTSTTTNIEKEVQPDQTNLDKFSYFCELICDSMTTVKINTKAEGVEVPGSVKEQHLIAAINWSHKFNLEDFIYDEEGVRGTLSFKERLFFTNIPWRSVWAISFPNGGKCREWKDDLPKEIFFSEEDD
jgi:hypothetical protein